MPLIVLIHGLPGSGKSHLAGQLKAGHDFQTLSLDEAYVSFVRDQCPELYFDLLRWYIGSHYDFIVRNREYSKHWFRRDYVDEWHEYLLGQIRQLRSASNRLAVEGYLLYDCKDSFQVELASDVRVIQIEVSNRTYKLGTTLVTADEIAALDPGDG
jgi:hypothetical protein